MKMVFIFLLLAFFLTSDAKKISVDRTVFSGEKIKFNCESNYPPIWTSFAKTDVQNLAVGGVKRKTFNNDRYCHGWWPVHDNCTKSLKKKTHLFML